MSTLIETIATQQRAHSADNAAIRPFRVSVPEAELADLRRRITATKFPERETVNDMSQGVPLATVAEARALLGDRIRLAKGGSEAQCPAAVHHRDRWAGHPLHSRAFET